MALEDRIQTLNWKSNFETIQNTSINGKNYITDYGHQFWSFTIQTVPLTREQFQSEFAVLFNDIDDGAKINIKAPKLNDAGSTVVDSLTGTASSGGQANVTTYTVDLLDGSTAGQQVTVGDFIQFSTHSKLYMINSTTSLDPDDHGGAPTGADITFTPGLQKNVSGGSTSVKFNNLEAQVIGIGETNQFSTDRDGYFIFEKEVREVF